MMKINFAKSTFDFVHLTLLINNFKKCFQSVQSELFHITFTQILKLNMANLLLFLIFISLVLHIFLISATDNRSKCKD